MFKSKKAEKKIKAIFEMQFQATQVPLLKAKNLMVSLVPTDAGKPSVRVGKAKIVEGNCNWENTIYETVKLVQETKTGRFKEKGYYMVVSTGSSRKSFLGEAYVDFADLIEASGVMMLSLPLQPSDSGAILNVTVHRIQPEQDIRNGIHEHPNEESNGGCLESEDQDCDIDRRSGLSSNEGSQYAKDMGSRDNSLNHGSTTTDNSSLSLNYFHRNIGGDSANKNSYKHSRTFTDWSSESASESNMDIMKIPEDNLQKGTFNETFQNTIERLENNIQALERQAELSELEIQSLRKQIAKDSRREQELSKQISGLRDERDSFRTKYEQLKSLPKFFEAEKTSNDTQEDTETGAQHVQNQNRKLRLKLQKAEDSNSELILSIRDLNKKLNQKNTEMSQLSSKLKVMEETTSELRRELKDNSDTFDGVKYMQKTSNNIADEAVEMKQIIEELYTEIEDYKKDKEALSTKVESISEKYEILKNENENLQSELDRTHIEMVDIQREHSESLSTAKWLKLQIERLEKERKNQELKYSESLEAINDLEVEITRLEKELERQAQEYEEHLGAVTQVNIEHENRARAAEDALHVAKYDAAQSVDRLHEEIRKLSVDVSFKIDKHEKISTDAIAEAHDLRLQNQALEELLERIKDEMKNKEANLYSEVEKYRVEYGELEKKFLKQKSEKEELQMQVSDLLKALTTSANSSKGGDIKGSSHLIDTSMGYGGPTQNRHDTKDTRCDEIGQEREHTSNSQINSKLNSEILELKERNKHMEVELKEMQDRYSDISLKFAEVEGERQQLVMTLRNLKNGKRN